MFYRKAEGSGAATSRSPLLRGNRPSIGFHPSRSSNKRPRPMRRREAVSSSPSFGRTRSPSPRKNGRTRRSRDVAAVAVATLSSSSRVNSPGSMSSPESVTSRSRSEASIRRSTRAPEKLSTSIASRRAYWVGPDSPLGRMLDCPPVKPRHPRSLGTNPWLANPVRGAVRALDRATRPTRSRWSPVADSKRLDHVESWPKHGNARPRRSANVDGYACLAHHLLKPKELNQQAESVLGRR